MPKGSTVGEAGVDALALLEAGGATPADAVLISLVNDLDVLAGPMVVALDDHHVIDGAAVHESVSFLLDNLPPQVTLAMATRADPPLALSRLRARGELVEARAADLRFTTDEAEVFLKRGDGADAGARARGCARGAYRGLGGRVAAGRAVGPNPCGRGAMPSATPTEVACSRT